MTDVSSLAAYLMQLMFYPFSMGGLLGHTILGFLVIIFAFGLVRRLFNRGCA